MGSIALAALLIAGTAATPALPFSAGAGKGGARVVAVAAPRSPWATVQLHIRLGAGDLSTVEQAQLKDVAAALAEGQIAGRKESVRAALAKKGGLVRAHVAVDGLIVAWGAPAEQSDALLPLVDEVLRSRGRLQPAGARPEPLPVVAEGPSGMGTALVAPGHPFARPDAAAVPADATVIAAILQRLCTKERVVVAVVGPRQAPDLLATAARALGAPLPSAPFTPPPFEPVPSLAAGPAGTRSAEQPAAANGAATQVWLFLPPPSGAPERAARRVLARLANARLTDAAGVQALALDLVTPAEEGPRVDALAALGRAPPAAKDVARAAAAARGALQAQLVTPDAIAEVLGRALLTDGDAGAFEAELTALAAVAPADVAAAALVAANAPRAVVPHVGAPR